MFSFIGLLQSNETTTILYLIQTFLFLSTFLKWTPYFFKIVLSVFLHLEPFYTSKQKGHLFYKVFPESLLL